VRLAGAVDVGAESLLDLREGAAVEAQLVVKLPSSSAVP
jgi:hypothetical protein